MTQILEGFLQQEILQYHMKYICSIDLTTCSALIKIINTLQYCLTIGVQKFLWYMHFIDIQ